MKTYVMGIKGFYQIKFKQEFVTELPVPQHQGYLHKYKIVLFQKKFEVQIELSVQNLDKC